MSNSLKFYVKSSLHPILSFRKRISTKDLTPSLLIRPNKLLKNYNFLFFLEKLLDNIEPFH